MDLMVVALNGTVQVSDTSATWWDAADPVVVGSPVNAWSDNSDGTYAEVVTMGGNDSGGPGSTGAQAGAFVYPTGPLAPEIPPGAQVEWLTFRVRARHATGQESPYNQGIYVQLYDQSDNSVIAGAGASSYEERVPPSANYPASWKFPTGVFTSQEYRAQPYNIAAVLELGWEESGFADEAEMTDYLTARRTRLANLLRSGTALVVVRGGEQPGDLPASTSMETKYDVAEASLFYELLGSHVGSVQDAVSYLDENIGLRTPVIDRTIFPSGWGVPLSLPRDVEVVLDMADPVVYLSEGDVSV